MWNEWRYFLQIQSCKYWLGFHKNILDVIKKYFIFYDDRNTKIVTMAKLITHGYFSFLILNSWVNGSSNIYNKIIKDTKRNLKHPPLLFRMSSDSSEINDSKKTENHY